MVFLGFCSADKAILNCIIIIVSMFHRPTNDICGKILDESKYSDGKIDDEAIDMLQDVVEQQRSEIRSN